VTFGYYTPVIVLMDPDRFTLIENAPFVVREIQREGFTAPTYSHALRSRRKLRARPSNEQRTSGLAVRMMIGLAGRGFRCATCS